MSLSYDYIIDNHLDRLYEELDEARGRKSEDSADVLAELRHWDLADGYEDWIQEGVDE